jgi:hypothetical protein
VELRLNKEGVQYVLGLPVKGNPTLFSQVVLSPGELEWLPSEVATTGFSSLADAHRVEEELRDNLTELPCFYQVTINRLEIG